MLSPAFLHHRYYYKSNRNTYNPLKPYCAAINPDFLASLTLQPIAPSRTPITHASPMNSCSTKLLCPATVPTVISSQPLEVLIYKSHDPCLHSEHFVLTLFSSSQRYLSFIWNLLGRGLSLSHLISYSSHLSELVERVSASSSQRNSLSPCLVVLVELLTNPEPL